jgi:hypothetical protein
MGSRMSSGVKLGTRVCVSAHVCAVSILLVVEFSGLSAFVGARACACAFPVARMLACMGLHTRVSYCVHTRDRWACARVAVSSWARVCVPVRTRVLFWTTCR